MTAPWAAGARQRTAIGWTADGYMVIYAEQKAKTIEEVKKEMRAAGCVDAINLDGGGSTQIAAGGYRNLYSSRKVHNYICVWEMREDAGCPYKEPNAMVYVGVIGDGAKWVQWNLRRRGYKGANGRELEIDGVFGGNSVYALKAF